MNPCSTLYLPGTHVAPDRTAAVLRNLASYKHKYPFVIYSEAPWHPSAFSNLGDHTFHRIDNPEVVKQEKEVAHVPKFTYMAGLEIVEKLGFTHFLTIETDVRVLGDFWDEAMFDEFFSTGPEMVLGGGPLFSWAPFNDNMEQVEKFSEFYERCNRTARKKPIFMPGLMIYGGRGSCEPSPMRCFPNGALSIAATEFVRSAFGYVTPLQFGLQSGQWDSDLGALIFRHYGLSAYDRLMPMDTILSLYGDLLTSEQFRKHLLLSGQVRAIHQVKSQWIP